MRRRRLLLQIKNQLKSRIYLGEQAARNFASLLREKRTVKLENLRDIHLRISRQSGSPSFYSRSAARLAAIFLIPV